jgi:2-octaprenyl-6-methoxyphenol hydroxylase
MTAQSLVANRLALIGETAHVFPPVGAQGLNLSMRDILDLTKTVVRAKQKGQDIGRLESLKPYETKRFSDIRSRTNAVDVLNRSLLTEFLPVQAARSAGMYLAGKIGPFRRLLMREGMAPGTGFQLRP